MAEAPSDLDLKCNTSPSRVGGARGFRAKAMLTPHTVEGVGVLLSPPLDSACLPANSCHGRRVYLPHFRGAGWCWVHPLALSKLNAAVPRGHQCRPATAAQCMILGTIAMALPTALRRVAARERRPELLQPLLIELRAKGCSSPDAADDRGGPPR